MFKVGDRVKLNTRGIIFSGLFRPYKVFPLRVYTVIAMKDKNISFGGALLNDYYFEPAHDADEFKSMLNELDND